MPEKQVGYQYGSADTTEIMRQRSAERNAAFLMPHLRSELSLLDVGCGPGTITLGLAARVAPGEVVGVDIGPEQVERARALAAQQGTANVSFEVGDAYELPFPDGSFDVVYSNAVLSHLGEPRRALLEMRRVLRPGGLAGVRDPLQSSLTIEPGTPGLRKFVGLWMRYMELKESPYYVPTLRQLMPEAGFTRVEFSVDAMCHATPEETRVLAKGLTTPMRAPDMWNTILKQGWSDPTELEEILTEHLAWGERPDAFLAWVFCSAVGWVGDTAQA